LILWLSTLQVVWRNTTFSRKSKSDYISYQMLSEMLVNMESIIEKLLIFGYSVE
jgi:hypothetical protein